MSREIKFRTWNGEEMLYLFNQEIFSGKQYDETTQPLMQYTGLKDKNGTEIYEGDVVRHDIWKDHKVIWEHGGYRLVSVKHPIDNDLNIAHAQLKRCRVIGNIYENPELLQKGDD